MEAAPALPQARGVLVRALQLWSLWWEILPGGFRVPAYRTTRNALLVFPCSLGLTDALKARELIKGCTARNYLGALEVGNYPKLLLQAAEAWLRVPGLLV